MYICAKCGNRITMHEGKPFMCFHCHTMQESDFVYYTEDFCIDLYKEHLKLKALKGLSNLSSIREWRRFYLDWEKSSGMRRNTIQLLTYRGSVLIPTRRNLRTALCRVLKLVAENKQDSKKEN